MRCDSPRHRQRGATQREKGRAPHNARHSIYVAAAFRSPRSHDVTCNREIAVSLRFSGAAAGDRHEFPMPLERLQKILAASGIASRRKSEELITAGRVTV